MFDYLQKFNNLPKELRDKVSSQEVMEEVLKLENKYGVELAALIMKVMVKLISVKSLPQYIASEFSLGAQDSKDLSTSLFINVFSKVANYLGIRDEFKKNKEFDEISALLEKTNLKLASEDLFNRLKNIILTYKKGVRGKLDTKNSLAKPVAIGGLALSSEEIDRIFKVLDTKQEPINLNINKNTDRTKLDKIIKEAEGMSGGYDLKKSIEEKNKKNQELNKISAPDTLKNFPILDHEKSLPLNEKKILLQKEEKSINLPLQDDFKKIDSKVINNDLDNEKEFKKNIPSDLREDEKVNITDTKKTLKNEILKELEILKNDNSSKSSVTNNENLEQNDKKSVLNKDKEIKETKINIEKESLDDHKDIKETIEKDLQIENKSKEVSKEKEEKKENIKEEKPVVKKESKEVKDDKQKTKIVSGNYLDVNKIKRPESELSNKRPILHDMKAIPKTMSPVDELKYLDLKNFRRLGDTADISCERILNKIKLLEKDGYDRMIKGIKAWHISEVNQLYVKIGREALLKGKKMREVIVERQKNGLASLKEDEIKAVAHLNSRLVF